MEPNQCQLLQRARRQIGQPVKMLVNEFENLVRLLPRQHQIALLAALEADVFQYAAVDRQPHRVIDDMPPLKRQRHDCAALLDRRDHALRLYPCALSITSPRVLLSSWSQIPCLAVSRRGRETNEPLP
jgi:hypothetical protein